MLVEKDLPAAVLAWSYGKEVIVMDRIEGVNVTMDEFIANSPGIHFLVNEVDDPPAPDPEEQHTDEEFEALFDEVPEVALEEAKEHLSSITKEKRTRAENRHMIEHLAKEHPELSVGEIAERVGVTAATVRRHIK